MSIDAKEAKRLEYDPNTVFNVPNILTNIRFALSIVLFCLLAFAPDDIRLYYWGMYVFIVAAGTDWIDGFYARRYNQVTTLGRILDPFVDKIIICGTFIFLAAHDRDGSGLTPAMAVVVVGRELMVTALRSFLEQQGADFSATITGKLKMVLQCVAAPVSLFRLSYGDAALPSWLPMTLTITVWAAVLLTVLSGVAYIFAAIRLLRR